MPQGSSVASDCSQIVDDIQRETRSFHSEAQQFGSKFVWDEAIDGAFDAFGKRLDGLDASDPVSAAAKGFREAEEAGKRLQSWDERLKRWGAGISGYKNCMKNPGCSFVDWLKEHEVINKEFAEWLKSFGGEPLEKTTERVEKASEFLKSYTAKVGSTATGTMASAAKCMADYSPRSQSASSQEPVPVAQTPAKDASPPKKGTSVGRVLVGVAAGTAAGLGGLYLANQYAAVDSSGSTSGGYDGTYDFAFVYTVSGAGNRQTMLSQFFRVNGGNITSSDGTLHGSVASSGAASFVGPCPINNDPADYVGNLSRSGNGEGTYRCRVGGISRTWSVYKR
jgi:hypothetical protein